MNSSRLRMWLSWKCLLTMNEALQLILRTIYTQPGGHTVIPVPRTGRSLWLSFMKQGLKNRCFVNLRSPPSKHKNCLNHH